MQHQLSPREKSFIGSGKSSRRDSRDIEPMRVAMKPIKFILLFSVSTVLLLSSCSPLIAPDSTYTAVPTATLTGTIAPPPPTLPTITIIPSAPSVPPATGTARPLAPIVYYYFVSSASNNFPPGSVAIMPGVLTLAPTFSDIARGPDTAANISSALQAMINDPRNPWTRDLGVITAAFNAGHADVALQGEVIGAGDVVLIAARMQILMTVFAEASVQTAVITLNGSSIGNLGVSRGSDAKPVDYRYTRAEIETFMTENAYTVP